MGIFEDLEFPYNEEVFETFITENVKIWKRLESGDINKTYLRANRWNIILQKLGIDYDGTIIEKRFENGVALGAYPVDGAYELLDYLKEKYELYVVSNGLKFVQESRVKIGKYDKYFKALFLSEDIGVQKPDTKFFDCCHKLLGYPDKSDIILIGDSLSADIKGGNDFGIDTIWFNIHSEKNTTEIEPTYTVNTLKEIESIL
jgi:YjjG family noncanonical pyrimidine nucleotidase